MPATKATSATGTLTRKTEDQSKYSSSRPPKSGPRPTPIAAVPAQMPIALARSSRGKTFVMIDSVAGMISAPPTPMSGADGDELRRGLDEEDGEARQTEERDAGLQRALAAEAIAERAHREQQAGEDETRYESTIHCNVELEASKCSCSDGRATLRMVLSSPMMTRLRARTRRVFQRRCVGEGSRHAAMVRSEHPGRIERITSPTP